MIKLTRLDEVIKKSVAYSMEQPVQKQLLSVLQDVNETLAMMYDKMCGVSYAQEDEEEKEKEKESTQITAYCLKYEELNGLKKAYIEYKGLPHSVFMVEIAGCVEGFPCGEVVIIKSIGTSFFKEKMEYGKTWRCWNTKPSLEQMEQLEWNGDLL